MWTSKSKSFAARFGISVPIIQAPMAGGPTTPELVASVTNGGGLGSFGAGYQTPEAIRGGIISARGLGAMRMNVNVFSSPGDTCYQLPSEDAKKKLIEIAAGLGVKNLDLTPHVSDILADQVGVLVQERVPIVSTTFGLLPDVLFQSLKAEGTLLIATATCIREAIAVERAGYDAVVAQGAEAGGHRGSFLTPDDPPLIGSMALIPQVVDAVSIPVIASGGIMDGRGVAAALLLGASAVQMGTAFLTTIESGADKVWVESIMNASDTQTTVTKTFSGKCARGLLNRFTTMMAPYEDQVGHYPLQNQITTPIRLEAKRRGNSDFMSLWCGQGVRLCRRTSAIDLIRRVVEETSDSLREAARG